MTKKEAADMIEREMRDGFLHPGVLADGSPIHTALTLLVEAARA